MRTSGLATIVCGVLSAFAPSSPAATTLSRHELGRGVSVSTPLGAFNLRADTHYYPDRGILKGANPSFGRYWYSRPTRGCGPTYFYLPIENDIGRMFCKLTNQLDGFAEVPVDTLRLYWTQCRGLLGGVVFEPR